MTEDPYRAGAIGRTGDFGHGLHLPYRTLPETEMIAVADPDSEGRVRAVEESGAKRGYADYREMLAEEALDVVSVSPRVPVDREEMIAAAAEAGCGIYSEKPLARDLTTADRIVETCDANGVALAVALQSRHVEPFRAVRRLIRRGDLGEIRSLHARGKEDHRGGGEDLVVLGHHGLDLMRFLTGTDPLWVFGHLTVDGRDVTRTDASEPTEPIGPVAGDSAVGMFGFPDGVRGYIYTGRERQANGDQYGITIVGSDGTISIRYADLGAPTISRAHGAFEAHAEFEPLDVGTDEADTDLPGSDDIITRGNQQAVRDLVESVTEDREPVASGRDARFALEMIHGVTAAHLQGRRLSFPLADRTHPLAST